MEKEETLKETENLLKSVGPIIALIVDLQQAVRNVSSFL